MPRRTAGFTGIEMLIVLIIAGVLLAMAVPALGRARARQGALNARDALVMLGARARAVAIEHGDVAELRVDAVTDRAWIQHAGSTMDAVDYSGEFDADVRISSGSAALCVRYNARGLGSSCGGPTLPDTVTFARGSYRARAVVQFLGQVSKR
ncbi:MAG TPA: type II secretion system protein [Longimicrobiales bacterium]